jgi:membrane-associated protein
MQTIAPWLSNALAIAGAFKYPLLLVGVIVEGPILMVASGFLLRMGFFAPVPLFLTVVLGDLVGDAFWYALGRSVLEKFLRNHGHFLSVTPELFEKAKGLFHRHHERILFISKVSLGFGLSFSTLMVAGAMRIPFRRYMLFNALGELVLVGVLLTTGYLFGHFYNQLARDLRIVTLVGGGIILTAVLVGFSRYIKRTLAAE